MSEAVFRATDEAVTDAVTAVDNVVTDPVIEHVLPPSVETVGTDVVKDVEDVQSVAEDVAAGNVAAAVVPATDAVKTTDDLIKEIHADIASVKTLLNEFMAELRKTGPMGLLAGLLKGSL